MCSRSRICSLWANWERTQFRTVGLTESLLTVIYGIAFGLTIGVTAMIARPIGGRDPDGAARVAVQAMVVGLILSAVLGVTGFGSRPHY